MRFEVCDRANDIFTAKNSSIYGVIAGGQREGLTTDAKMFGAGNTVHHSQKTGLRVDDSGRPILR